MNVTELRAARERLRDGRLAIVERYSQTIEDEKVRLLRAKESRLLQFAAEIYGWNGLEVPAYQGKEELADWIVFAAQAYVDHAATPRIIFLSRVENQLQLIDSAARLECDGWVQRFRAIGGSGAS